MTKYAEEGNWLAAVSRFEDVRDAVGNLGEDGCVTGDTHKHLTDELKDAEGSLAKKNMDLLKPALWRLNLVLSTVGITDLAKKCQQGN